MANIAALTQRVAQTTSAVGKGAVKTIGNAAGNSVLGEFTPRAFLSNSYSILKTLAFAELPGFRSILYQSQSFMKNLKRNSETYLREAQKTAKDTAASIKESIDDAMDSISDLLDDQDDNAEGFEIAQASLDALDSMDQKFSDLIVEVMTLSDITAKVWGVSKEELEQIGLTNQLQRMQIDDARKFQAENELDQQIAAAQALETHQQLRELAGHSSSAEDAGKDEGSTFWSSLLGVGLGSLSAKIGGKILSGVMAAVAFAGTSVLGTLLKSITTGAGALARGGFGLLVGGASALAGGIGTAAAFLTTGSAAAVISKLGIVGLLGVGIVGGFAEAWDTYEKGGTLGDVIFSFMDGFVTTIWGTVTGMLSLMGDLIKWAVEPSIELLKSRAEEDIAEINRIITNQPLNTAMIFRNYSEGIATGLTTLLTNVRADIEQGVVDLEERLKTAVAEGNDEAIRKIAGEADAMEIRAHTYDIVSQDQKVLPSSEVGSPQTDQTILQATDEVFQTALAEAENQIKVIERLTRFGQMDMISADRLKAIDEMVNSLNDFIYFTDDPRSGAIQAMIDRYNEALNNFEKAMNGPVEGETSPGFQSMFDPALMPSDAEKAFDMFSSDNALEDLNAANANALTDYLKSLPTGPGGGASGIEPGSPLSNWLINQGPTINAPTFISPAVPRDDWQGPAASPASPFRVSQ